MKCPNCGAEVDENSLYCSVCGQDIHMVPDYECEVEHSMSETMSRIMEDVFDDTPEDLGESPPKNLPRRDRGGGGRGPAKRGRRGRKREKGGFLSLFSIALMVCAIVGILAAGGYFYENYSLDYQLDQARSCVQKKEYESAIGYYARAAQLDRYNMDIRASLADVYFLNGNEEEYIDLLMQIIRDGYSNREQVETAYGKVIGYYRDREEYQTICRLLETCGDEQIRNTYQNYMAMPPEFSSDEGVYEEVIPLKLSSPVEGRIYYTLDGSDPGPESEVYTAPIFLEQGNYRVRAVFVNSYGVWSPVVEKDYEIELAVPRAPRVLTEDGEYFRPAWIVVEAAEGENVYYTVNGQDPTLQSSLYTGPIPMPIGSNIFRFASAKEDGIMGEVTLKKYDLELDAPVSVQDAEASLMEKMYLLGKVEDLAGSSQEIAGYYQYRYQYAVTIGERDYYVIAELESDGDGSATRTGSYYAADVRTGEIYRLQIESGQRYTLLEMIQAPAAESGQ